MRQFVASGKADSLTDRVGANRYDFTQVEKSRGDLVCFGQREPVLARKRADRFCDDLAADDRVSFEYRHRSLGLRDVRPFGVDDDVRVSEGLHGRIARRD